MQKRKQWSLSDERFLRENYDKGSAYCAEMLNCSINAVDMKAFKLKIRRGKVGGQQLTHTEYEERLMQKEIDCYPVEEYKGSATKILHSCINGHQWSATPSNILSGYGCPSCSSTGFKSDKPAVLYYVKLGDYYKIGVTNRTVRARFAQDKDKPLIILQETKYSTGAEAKVEEQRLFNLFPPINVPGYLKHGGNSELYDYDVLNLANQK